MYLLNSCGDALLTAAAAAATAFNRTDSLFGEALLFGDDLLFVVCLVDSFGSVNDSAWGAVTVAPVAVDDDECDLVEELLNEERFSW